MRQKKISGALFPFQATFCRLDSSHFGEITDSASRNKVRAMIQSHQNP